MEAPWDIFIAYATPDRDSARELYSLLSPERRVFLDAESLRVGDRWYSEVAKAQYQSRATVVLLSQFTDAAWYETEEIVAAIQMARARQRETPHKLIPVFLKGKPEDSALPYGLAAIHAADAATCGGLRGVADKILQAVPTRLAGEPSEPTTPPSPATVAEVRLASVDSELPRDSTSLSEAVQRESELERRLREAQKMEAVGRLAGGIAHDFNNLITVIIGHANLLSSDLKSNPERSHLSELIKAAELAAQLTRQLLAFSRRAPLDRRIVNVNDLVTSLNRMLQRLIGEDIQLDVVLHESPLAVDADPGQIEQVLLNLLVNARDAMPDGGRITLQTSLNSRPSEEFDVGDSKDPHQEVVISVTDTGIGMDASTKEKIFDPFFTTKEPGHGTGLGLAVVYGIVKQHNGHIEVTSKPGSGARFEVSFPLVGEDQGVKAQTRTQARLEGRRVLVVEDEDSVRMVVAQVLRRAGCIVTEARGIEEAFEAFDRHNGNFHLVMTDVVLADGSGLFLVEELRNRSPGLALLLNSGYTDHKAEWPAIRSRGIPFLHKPFSEEELLQVFRNIVSSTED